MWFVGSVNIPDPGVPGLTPAGWTEFDFDITGPDSYLREASLGSLDSDDTEFRLVPGSYAVTETVPDMWQMEAECSLNDGTPAAYTNGASTALAAGDTLSCVFTNFAPHKVIVIVCHENTNDLWPSSVENGAETKESISQDDLAGTDLETLESALCELDGFGGKPHGASDFTVDVAEHADLQEYGGH